MTGLSTGCTPPAHGPGPRSLVRVRAPRSAGSQTTTHAPRFGRSSNRPVRPAWRARGEIHVQPERKNHGEEYVGQRHGDHSPACSPAARRATPDVQRACGPTTKYPVKGVLHDFVRGDAGLRRT